MDLYQTPYQTEYWTVSIPHCIDLQKSAFFDIWNKSSLWRWSKDISGYRTKLSMKSLEKYMTVLNETMRSLEMCLVLLHQTVSAREMCLIPLYKACKPKKCTLYSYRRQCEQEKWDSNLYRRHVSKRNVPCTFTGGTRARGMCLVLLHEAREEEKWLIHSHEACEQEKCALDSGQ